MQCQALDDVSLLDLGGTLRTATPQTTLLRAKQYFPRIGITRVANVTGLDIIGIPTWVAVRPLAKSLSVSQGKGLTDELAQVSAVMEAIEIHHAEERLPRGHILPLSDTIGHPGFVQPDELPIRASGTFSSELNVEWIDAVDLDLGICRRIPRELVDLDFTKRRHDETLFQSSSNGLASGNCLREAQLHALCEVIERDQVSFWVVARDLGIHTANTRMDISSIDDQQCRFLLDRIYAAGLDVCIWNCTGEFGIACFACSIYDARGATLFPQRASGFGCHPYKRIALSRAITEAIQSRLTHISGSRDDLFWSRFTVDLPVQNQANQDWIARQKAEQCSCDWSSVSDAPLDASLTQLMDWMLLRLRERGISEVLCVDLTCQDIDIPVVKIVVPRMEFKIHSAQYTPGPRMQAFLAGRI